uniref:Bromo domain-containing protein n=1 Tax=Ciona savignyi TaxID=51511 RepID=H2YAJ4_CIOSA
MDEDEEEGEDENGVPYRRYSLRTKRAQPHRLNYELVQHTRRPARTMFDQLPRSPVRRKRVFAVDQNNPTSPYQRRHLRTNSQVHASSSGSTSQSDDEKKFDRRKSRSMAKARNKCLPMNLSASELATHGFARERVKIGSSLADVDPMTLDKSVKFSSIGGHKHHIRSLKEMVVFPLIYPEIFTRFNIAPPRGCLFHGPPGTGKTLMARALVNECSTDSRKVAFFMRKGADCLSKWVGESERQLRLLFDQAYQMRPSIIFFDEIDGLAPVRSSRQDQIHSSIVSTLLALMDGLDSRGEIVVIGATNRIDSIDPALRRPGRFDREFLFPLPDKKSRHEILKIHTAKWEPPLPQPFVENLAEKTVGYCGADLKALCTEATLHALRKSFPQIYATNDKLKLDVNQISIGPNNFYQAMKSIVPTAQRSHPTPAYPLSPSMVPLLQATLIRSIAQLARVFPITLSTFLGEIPNPDENADSDSDDDDEADSLQNATSLPPNGLSTLTSNAQSYRESVIHRPRLMICGADKAGHTTHLAPAILHDIEGLPLHLINIASLFSISACTPEESCSQVFREAIRTAPCIIYLPDITTWWNCASDTLRYTFQSHLQSVPTSSPVLVIATSNEPHMLLPHPLSTIFNPQYDEVFNVSKPTTEERTLFFAPIFNKFAVKPPVQKDLHKKLLPSLERAPPPPVVELTKAELKNLELSEESTMRSLRLFLRDVLTRLAQDRRFKVFLKPVDLEEVEDYADVIENPMDISTMMNRIDQHKYQNVASFLSDINLICSNALEYNPDFYKSLRHRACLLKDMAHAIVEEDLDPNFERKCNEVIDAQQRRKANPSKFAPSYYNVLPKNKKTPTQQLEEDEELSEDEPPLVCNVEGVEDAGLDHEQEVESDQEDRNEMKVRTRSMGSQPPDKPIVVDPYKLKRLLEYTVQVTSKLMVADLERLYSILSRSIYRHRHDYDKTQLTQ